MADDKPGEQRSALEVNGSDHAAFEDGYQRVMREIAWVRARGWNPTQRELTVALMQAVRVYATVRGGKVVSGQRPEWLHGRAEALRELLRGGVGA